MKVALLRLDVDHARRLLEDRLAREGLAPLDDPMGAGKIWRRGVPTGERSRLYDSDDAAAREKYLAWARELLRRRDYFPRQRADASVQLRAVWRLHAQGKSNGQVARKLRVSRGVVEKALRVVVRRAPPPPVANPWRRSGREQAWKHIEAKRNERRTSMAAETKQGPQWVKYALIRLRSMETVNIPGLREKRDLIDVDGRMHAGGIDVKIDGAGYESIRARAEKLEGHDLIITVPWYKIDQVERVVEGT
ncbi:MAG TPA: hypothetical protein VMB76_09645 [Casimicrobiaceae bacterium]|jgi:hypothetical protein|nr:hypothetical protein [Casimicrobiaceae bacterium]